VVGDTTHPPFAYTFVPRPADNRSAHRTAAGYLPAMPWPAWPIISDPLRQIDGMRNAAHAVCVDPDSPAEQHPESVRV